MSYPTCVVCRETTCNLPSLPGGWAICDSCKDRAMDEEVQSVIMKAGAMRIRL